MTRYELWKFLHIASMMVWIGGAVVAQVFGVLTQRAASPVESAAFGRNMTWTARWVFLPSSIIVILTGIALTDDGNWEWSEPFILFGLVAGVLIAALGIGYVTPRMGRAGARVAAEGPSPALLAEMSRLIWIARSLILVGFVIVLMMVGKLGT